MGEKETPQEKARRYQRKLRLRKERRQLAPSDNRWWLVAFLFFFLLVHVALWRQLSHSFPPCMHVPNDVNVCQAGNRGSHEELMRLG